MSWLSLASSAAGLVFGGWKKWLALGLVAVLVLGTLAAWIGLLKLRAARLETRLAESGTEIQRLAGELAARDTALAALRLDQNRTRAVIAGLQEQVRASDAVLVSFREQSRRAARIASRAVCVNKTNGVVDDETSRNLVDFYSSVFGMRPEGPARAGDGG